MKNLLIILLLIAEPTVIAKEIKLGSEDRTVIAPEGPNSRSCSFLTLSKEERKLLETAGLWRVYKQAEKQQSKRNWIAARNLYQKILARQPQVHTIEFNLGVLEFECLNFSESLNHFARCLELDPYRNNAALKDWITRCRASGDR